MLVIFGLAMLVAAFIATAFFGAKVALGIIGLLVFGVATLRSPYFGLLLYIVVLYVRPGEIGLVPESLHFERVVVLGLMVLVFFQRALGHTRALPANPINRVMLCFWLAVGIGVPFAFWKGGAFNGFIDVSKLLLLYLGIIYLADDVKKLRTLMWVALLAWAWYGFSAVTGYASGTSVYQGEAYVMRGDGPHQLFWRRRHARECAGLCRPLYRLALLGGTGTPASGAGGDGVVDDCRHRGDGISHRRDSPWDSWSSCSCSSVATGW